MSSRTGFRGPRTGQTTGPPTLAHVFERGGDQAVVGHRHLVERHVQPFDHPFTTPWGPNTTRPVTVAGAAGVPVNADAVVLNATVTGTTGNGFLTIWPSGQARPGVSSLNWAPGVTIPNTVTPKLGGAGAITIRHQAGSVQVIVDTNGWYG